MSYSDSDLVGLDADECRIIMKKRAKIELKNLYDIKNTLSNNLFDVSKYNNSYSKIDNEIVSFSASFNVILQFSSTPVDDLVHFSLKGSH